MIRSMKFNSNLVSADLKKWSADVEL